MILFYDCFAGISGDMNLAALIDLGVDSEYLKSELAKLNLSGYQIKVSQDIRRGITGTRVDVLLGNAEPVFVINRPASHMIEIQHDTNTNHAHHHDHRSYADIRRMIEASTLSEKVKTTSIAIFKKLAEAEGKIHNKPIEEVHFHEVGAIDSIVDIVGAAICLDFLNPSKIIASSIELGSGMVKCAHGLFPVPAPATMEVLKRIPVKTGLVPFEATTPTGAAILAVVVDEFVSRHQFQASKTAYGIGHKDSEVPNVLRVQALEEKSATFKTEEACILECNIDDMNPEIYDYLFEKLFKLGADDVFLVPISMKKSRPASILTVLCNASKEQIFIEFLLKETSSLGVRSHRVTKHMLDREIIEIETSLGKVRIKKAWYKTEINKFKPEYDDCARIAKEKNLPLLQVMNQILKEVVE